MQNNKVFREKIQTQEDEFKKIKINDENRRKVTNTFYVNDFSFKIPLVYTTSDLPKSEVEKVKIYLKSQKFADFWRNSFMDILHMDSFQH